MPAKICNRGPLRAKNPAAVITHATSCIPQQGPGTQSQDSEGGEGKIKKGPAETPASVTVAKKNNAPEEEYPLGYECALCSWVK